MRRLLISATRQLHVSISKEYIKPASPTPFHLKSYRLSSMDQFSPRIYMPMILFYPNYGCDTQWKLAEKSRCLKSSLSETLTKYYPLAGRLVGGVSVGCNDEGVEFVETRIKCTLSEILKNTEPKALDQVYPEPYNGSSLLVVQLNYFECGGLALAVCMSHKIADACTLCNFLTYWAARASHSNKEVSPHLFLWPSNDSTTLPEIEYEKNFVTRRFVFPNSKIAQLKAMAASHPSRVQVLTSLLYKCATAAASRANSGCFRPSALFFITNMRPRMVPPLPPTSVGNFYGKILIPTRTECEMEWNSLSDQIKNGLIQARGRVEKLDANECLSTLRECINENLDLYMCSSLCRFPYYQLDFGWGKPMRVIRGRLASKNTFILMDTPSGDGIEAQVSLEEQSMAVFENDKELLAFASLQRNNA